MNDNPDPELKAIAENKSATSPKVDCCRYTWVVRQCCEELFQSKTHIDSPKFKSTTNDEFSWRLRLRPPDWYKMINVMLFLLVDTRWYKNILVRCKMCVVNGKGEQTNIQEQTHQKFAKIGKTTHSNYYSMKFSNFLSECDLLNKSRLLLKNGSLTITCEIYFIEYESDKINITFDDLAIPPLTFQVKKGGLQEDLERLLEKGDFSDFTLSINGVKYPVHKTILAARSEVFASMLKHEMKETNHNLVEIQDINQNVFEEMLHFMYTGKSPNLDDVAFDLLAAAEKYDLKHLKTMCELSLIKKLTVEGVVDSLIFADTYHAAQLKQEAIQFIKTHITDVKKTKTWLKIKRSDLFDEIFDALFP